MATTEAAKARTIEAFESVRRRVLVASVFVVTAHGALGAAFGSLLAWIGDGGPWAMAALALVAGAMSAAWAAGRLPAVAAGRLIERRFPECRNVLVTAEELLAGALEATDDAADRVFNRAAAMLARIEPSRAAMVGRRIVASLAVIAASALVIALLWSM
ncbi:MAG: hypothetical protein WD690_07605 [Vicinamibacterales bacterium]